jgi:hypothetical protein
MLTDAKRPRPARGWLLVRPIETAETMPGGLVLLTSATRESLVAWQCEAIAVGPQAICEDEDCDRLHDDCVVAGNDDEWLTRREHPCAARAGDWLLVRPRSYIATDQPERAEWFVGQDNVLAILREEAP